MVAMNDLNTASAGRNAQDRLDLIGTIIVRYGRQDVRGLVRTLEANGIDSDNTLIVHNPASKGDAVGLEPLHCRTLVQDRNGGYAAAVNAGIRELQRKKNVDYYLVLTHDVILPLGLVGGLLQTLISYEGCGAVGPCVIFEEGLNQRRTYGGSWTPERGAYHLSRGDDSGEGSEGGQDIQAVDWLEGSAMLIARAASDVCGPLREDFFLYYEEPEWFLRLRHAGFLAVVDGSLSVRQMSGRSKRFVAFEYLMTRNGLAFARASRGFDGVWRYIAKSMFRNCPTHQCGAHPQDDDQRELDGFPGNFGRGKGLFLATLGTSSRLDA